MQTLYSLKLTQKGFTVQTRQGLAWPSQTLEDLMWERICMALPD